MAGNTGGDPIPVPSAQRPRHLPGYVSLQNIVFNVLNEMNMYDFAEYKRLMQFAILGFTQLNLYDLTNFRVIYLEVNSAGIVELPDDCIDWIKIGEVDQYGNVRHWSYNRELYIDKSTIDGARVNPFYNANEDSLDTETMVGCVFAPHIHNDVFCNTLYGSHGGYAPGYFTVDKEERVVRCDRTPPGGKIVIEYNSTGIDMDGATWIPRQAVLPMIEWIHWRRKKEDPSFTRGERADSKQNFLESEEALRAYENAPTIQELQDVIFESYTQSIKR